MTFTCDWANNFVDNVVDERFYDITDLVKTAAPALYPIALACGMEVELPVFYRASGLIHTFIFAAAGLSLILRKETKRENRYYAAVLLYIALGTLMFGVMMGET